MIDPIIQTEFEILARCRWFGADVSQIILHDAEFLRALATRVICEGLQLVDAASTVISH